MPRDVFFRTSDALCLYRRLVQACGVQMGPMRAFLSGFAAHVYSDPEDALSACVCESPNDRTSPVHAGNLLVFDICVQVHPAATAQDVRMLSHHMELRNVTHLVLAVPFGMAQASRAMAEVSRQIPATVSHAAAHVLHTRNQHARAIGLVRFDGSDASKDMFCSAFHTAAASDRPLLVDLDVDASSTFLRLWDRWSKHMTKIGKLPKLAVHATSGVRPLVARGAYIVMSCRSFTRHAQTALSLVPLSRALFATMDGGLYYSLTEPMHTFAKLVGVSVAEIEHRAALNAQAFLGFYASVH